MATVKGMTPEEIIANIAETVSGGNVDGSGDLILSLKNGSVYNAGHVQGPSGPDGPQGPIGTRWGTTTSWLFAGTTNIPVSFPDGQPPRLNDVVVSTNSLGLGDVAKVIAVVDATHADVQYLYNIRGPQGPAYTPTDSGWIDVTFSNGWVHFEATRRAQVRKIDKHVTFRGLMKSGTIGSGVTAFSVPAGYQPQATVYADRHFLCVTNPYTTGVIQANAASRTFEVVNGSNVWFDLSMIQYSTA